MGNKYYVFHGLLSQMSRFVQQGHRHEDLGLGVAVTSIHRVTGKRSSRKLGFRHTEVSETQDLLYNAGREVHPTEEGGGMKHAY
jgi:hypothetical protein